MSLHHSHRVDVAEAYSFLRMNKDTTETFIKYFQDGLSPSEAKSFHRSSLLATTPVEDIFKILADAHINPTNRSIYYLIDKWRQVNYW